MLMLCSAPVSNQRTSGGVYVGGRGATDDVGTLDGSASLGGIGAEWASYWQEKLREAAEWWYLTASS